MDVVYVNLIRIRNAHPGLRSNNIYPGQWEEWQTKPDPQGYGVDVDKGVVIYHRWGNAVDGKLERFIVVLNFSDNLQTVDIPFSVNGAWDELLSGGPPVTVENFSLPGQRVESNWGRIYYNKE